MAADAADASGKSEFPNEQGAMKSTPEKAPDTGGMEELANPAIAKTLQSNGGRKFSQERKTEDRRPKKRRPGFHEDMFEETNYYFKKGLRFVYPYKFTFTAHVKLRWMGLKVIDVFNKEFHMETVEYYTFLKSTRRWILHELWITGHENFHNNEQAKASLNTTQTLKLMESVFDHVTKSVTKNALVNGKPVAEDYILKHGDILQTMVHRHEPPVVNEPIEFIRNDEEIVVINKPSSIPVHPCGRYRHNTVVFLLGKEHHRKGLHTIHRIDRLTSGILMFAKTSSKAKELEAAVKGRLLEKEYLARVRGEFPEGEITVNEPIITASHKVGVCHVDETGKECTTVFKRLHYNGRSSVVVCKPLTGRMHQIRVHLQWLGFPIINDPIYNHSTAWGENKGKHGPPPNMDEVIVELLRTRKDNSYDFDLNTDKPNAHFKLERAPPAKKVKTESIEENLDQVSDHIQSLTSTINSDSAEKYMRSTNIQQDGNKTTEEEKADKIKTMQNASETQTKDFSIKCIGEDLFNSDILEDAPNRIEIKPKNNSSKDLNTEGNTLNVTNNEEINESPSNRGTGHTTYTSRELGEQYFDEDCTECKRTWKEPFLSELVMYLHAYSYKGSDFHYTTSIPDWAKEEWKE